MCILNSPSHGCILMFIRKTKKIDPKNHQEYFMFQLVESVRTENGPRQRILLNLGSNLDLEAEELKELANCIEDIVKGQLNFLPVNPKIEALAQKYASKLIHNLSQPCQPLNKIKRVPEYHTIDIDSIEHLEPRSIGCEHLLHHVANQLELQKIFQDLGLNPSQIALALGSIYSRAIFPASERASLNWLKTQSGLGELLNFDFTKTPLTNFYLISDVLFRHKHRLEDHLNQSQKRLHGHSSTLVLYDLTNTYMEGQAKANPKARHGRSKEKRSDCPLVTLGLVLDEHGFYVRSQILPGNVSEPKTLQEAIEKLHDSSQLFKPTILLDAGIASIENLEWLRQNQYSYIVSARQKAPSSEIPKDMEEVGRGVSVALLSATDDEETWLYCDSPAKEATALEMKTLFQQRFENALQKIVDSLKKPRANKTFLKIHERISRAKETHKRISGCYDITIQTSPDGKNVVGIEWKIIPEKLETRLTGKYYLRTNLKNRTATQLWELYRTIGTVEDAFRFMKSSLGMRPVHHQKEVRVDGHLWITILAYCLIQNLLYQLKQSNIKDEWKTVRDGMSSRIRVTMQAKTDNKKTLYVRTTTKPEGYHKEIYEALSLNSVVLRSKKTVV